MDLSVSRRPTRDPTGIFELFRGNYGTELLTAAVVHLRLFEEFHDGPRAPGELRKALGLAERPAHVLLTAVQAFGLLYRDADGRLDATPLAKEFLSSGSPFEISRYVRLASETPGVLEMVERLRTNKPSGAESGTTFTFRSGMPSAMDDVQDARELSLALAGRAKNVAPVLAERIRLSGGTLVDVGGGTGLYSIAFLQRHPNLYAIIVDRPAVLEVAAEFVEQYGLKDRVTLHEGDMFEDEIPTGDTMLLSNVLHDWDVPECQQLVKRCADALPTGGHLLIHDAFLNDALDGPLPVALYSAALFSVTEGRAYSEAEYRIWLEAAGLVPEPALETLVHCSVIRSSKP